MATVDYLGGRSGVQYDGIQIEEDANGVDLQNVLLVGEFKRGPFNRPFKVTKETMEAKLSFDYNNPYYTFLEDAFAHGAEYIWVMRVSREQVVEPEPIWGDWILNPDVTVNTNGIAYYTAYKTNQREYYDSYANLDLTTAIVRSLSDTDMQQWQAVKDAANQLTGVTDWFFDNQNKSIRYIEAPDIQNAPDPNWIYFCHNNTWGESMMRCGNAKLAELQSAVSVESCRFHDFAPRCTFKYIVNGKTTYSEQEVAFFRTERTEPIFEEKKEKSIQFDVVAQKIISNASSSNQAISLLAETYLEAVANSIFNADESEQFVKLLDIEPDFEANKTQR